MKFKLKFNKPRSLAGRIALWVLPALLVLFIGGFLFLRSWLASYLQSEAFRQWLGRMTSKQLNARCEYEPFHFSGLTINADAFKAQGTQKAAFSTLELDNIRTAIILSGLWKRALQIDEVSIQRLQISLGHTGAPPVPESEIGVEPVRENTPVPSRTSWLAPKLELSKVVVHDTNVLWGEKTTQAGSVTNTEVTVKPDGDAWNVLLQGGTISQKGGPDLKLDHIKLHYQAPVVTLTEGLLQFPPGGNIALSGDVDTERKLDVQIKVNSIPLTPFLPPGEQSKFQGLVFADVNVSGPIPVETPPVVSGSGHLENASIEGLPSLASIVKFTHSPQYQKIKLNTASANFVYAGQKVTVTNLVIESRGLVSIEGGFVINNSRINGTFEVGIPHEYLKWLPFLEEKVFTRDHAGYRWAPMHVTGPLSSPQEDLLHRIETALPAAALDVVTDSVKELPKAPEVPKKALDGLFKDLHK